MRYNVKDFLPLIVIFCFVIVLTLLNSYVIGNFDAHTLMNSFMGFFFIIFGLFKIINLSKFAIAYAMYDLIAMRSTAYSYIYPFIELGLGIAYLSRVYPTFVNAFTAIIMLVSATGVAKALNKGPSITCACLGAVFKVPMTYVTLAEDLLMAGMALIMLF